MGTMLNLNAIENYIPDEWVLSGNPVLDQNKIDVLSSIPICHSKDKKEVCYIGRDKTAEYAKVTLIFTQF